MKWERALKQTTLVCNQAATFNCYVKKAQDEAQDSFHILFGDLGKSKSSHKADKALNEIKALVAFIVLFGKSNAAPYSSKQPSLSSGGTHT